MTATDSGRRRRNRWRPDAVVAPLTVLVLLALVLLSIAVGSVPLSWHDLLHALFSPSGEADDLVVRDLRIPRTLVGLAAGAGLAVAGVLAQALTRNPLAEPGILGVNAGAAFAVALGVVVLGVDGFGATIWLAAAGAALVSIAVALLGAVGRDAGLARLVLAGVVVAAVLSAATAALSLVDPRQAQLLRAWEAGSLAGRSPGAALTVLAVVGAGLVLALSLGRGLGLLLLGDDTARALGGRIAVTRVLGFAAIAVLSGAATAAAGPIAFVGLMVPHAVRLLVGADQVRMLWHSLLVGPILLLGADLLGRVLIAPREIPVGVVTAFLGAPVLIAPREIPVGVVTAFLGAPVLVALVLARRTTRGAA